MKVHGPRVTVVMAALGSLAVAPPPAGWEALLAQPLSPGTVALLVEHADDARVAARWGEALKDDRPLVRATASRAINVSATVSLVPQVAAALVGEADFVAAREHMGALAALGGPARQADLRAAAERDPRLSFWFERVLALRRDPPAPGGRPTTWRTPEGYPPGLVADLLRASGCATQDKDAYHGGRVVYASDGRPREVATLAPGRLPPGCADAVTALLYLGLSEAEPAKPEGHTDLVIVPLATDWLACIDESLALRNHEPEPALRVEGQIQEPKKVRHVNPRYPDDAKANRIQGMVVLEATIAPSGCVRSIKLLRSAHPQLDLASLLTVMQWRYTPTLLNGVAVPVIMTVTVNFRLS
jgi:TonB family protein